MAWAKTEKERRDRRLASKRKWAAANLKNARDRSKRWATKNPAKTREKSKRYYATKGWDAQLRRRYGITSIQYDAMHKRQLGKCKICREPEREGVRLAVDHCHNSGRIRGLLCRQCNVGIGRLKESPVLLRRAAGYLE